MRLYGSTRSPFARKAAIVAHEAGLWPDIAFIEIEIPSPSADSRLREANPLMKLPTLVDDAGAAVFDSTVICEYLAAAGRAPLFPVEGAARWRALTRQALADGLLDMLLLWRAELRRPEEGRIQALIESWTMRRDMALDRCNADAGAPAASGIDIGDIAVGILLEYLDFRFPEFDWRKDRPALVAWRDRICARQSFHETPFGKPWKSSSAVVS